MAGAQVVLFDVAELSRGPVGQATTDEAGQFALPLTAASGALMLPQGFALGANYPNPFNPSTLIPYQLSATSQVRLEVFNILGQRVATLVDEEQQAGSYRARWDGTAAAGGAAASGVYFYRLTVAGAHQTGKMVLMDGQAGVPLGGPSVVSVPQAGAGAGRMGWWCREKGWWRMWTRILASAWGRWIWWCRRRGRDEGRWWCRRWRGAGRCGRQWAG